jgi:hypothetical protein
MIFCEESFSKEALLTFFKGRKERGLGITRGRNVFSIVYMRFEGKIMRIILFLVLIFQK